MTNLVKAQIALDAVRREEHLAFARQDHKEAVEGLKMK